MPETPIDLGPPVFVWRDDPLFNQGHIAAELALAALRGVMEDGGDANDVEQAAEHLEAFLEGARAEAGRRAAIVGVQTVDEMGVS